MNGFSSADMSTAAANGYAEGYQAGYADAVKVFEAAQPAAAQEAVAWAEGYASGVIDERTSEANIGIAGYGAKVEPARANPYLYAAPVAAAPVDGLHLAVIGRTHFGNPIPQEWYAAARELLASTPAAPGIVPVHFVNLMDILRDEYAEVNWDTSAPLNSVRDSLISALNAYDDVRAVLTYTPSPMAAPGIDLEQFRLLANSWIVEAAGIAAEAKHACADELLALIDASPKGVINPEWSLHDRVEFALRDAGFDLDEAAFVAEAASVANGDLDSPKGGSTSDCPIIRLAPGEYTDWEKRVWRRGVIECATQPDIAAAMQATSAEVGE